MPKRYYSSEYGWRTVRDHVITLTHLKDDITMFTCSCYEADYVGPERIVGAMMMAHRMEVFPSVRQRLGGNS